MARWPPPDILVAGLVEVVDGSLRTHNQEEAPLGQTLPLMKDDE
jgi:hypothetical protein